MDKTIWHKCRNPFIPRRTVDGSWTSWSGQAWRRWVNGKWEYQQDEETQDDLDARVW
jgi:hypothetical protein